MVSYSAIARVDGLTASLEFSQGEVDDLKGDASEHRIHSNCLAEVVASITTKLDIIKAQNDELQRKAVKRDDYTWRRNLLLIGIPKKKGENCSAEVRGIFSKILKMQKEQVARMSLLCHRLGPFDAKRARPIIVKFQDFDERRSVYDSKRKLDVDDAIKIAEHFSEETTAKKKL